MAPILYGNLARLSANSSFLWSLLQPAEKIKKEVKRESKLELTLGDQLLQLYNVVSGAEGGGDDE